MTSEITNPSRRSVTKGAAWAVPAVAVAATAPSLAASTNYCAKPSVAVEPVCPPIDLDILDGNSKSLYYTVTNTGDCTIESGLEFTLESDALVEGMVQGLNDIQVDAAVQFTDEKAGVIDKDIAPGEMVEIHVFPVSQLDVNLQVSGETKLTVAGMSSPQQYTLIEADVLGAAAVTLAFCGDPQTIVRDVAEAVGEELKELPGELVDLLNRLGIPVPPVPGA